MVFMEGIASPIDVVHPTITEARISYSAYTSEAFVRKLDQISEYRGIPWRVEVLQEGDCLTPPRIRRFDALG